jgi:tetratricopeptide (TPR) repeat protein
MKQDAFSTVMFSAREWVGMNLRTVLMAVGAIVAVVAISWGAVNYMQGREADAAGLFGQAGVELRSNNLSAASISLQRVLDEYGGSAVADAACFQFADVQYRLRSFDDARVTYQRYLDDYAGDPLLVASAWGALAAIDEQANDFAAAAEKNLRAATLDLGSFQTSEYLRHAIRCAIAGNDSATALKAFAMLEESGADARNIKTSRQTLVEKGLLPPTGP